MKRSSDEEVHNGVTEGKSLEMGTSSFSEGSHKAFKLQLGLSIIYMYMWPNVINSENLYTCISYYIILL